jgi:sigma-B regulation protein RsbU (phosphoserine phosphatase)
MNRIVVIEDDPAILHGLEATLRSESYDVLIAVNGEDGYRIIQEKLPDLVILDLMLPKMNGYDVCGQIRRHGLATPILMLTAQDQESSRVQGFDAGADDYVTKPFSVRELLGRVRAILRRSEGRSDLANQRELDEARRVQQRLLPVEIPQLDGFRIAGTWCPARIAAGDYFDVFKLGDSAVAVCIADVCGKGMPAAMMMSNLQAAVKSHALREMRPRDLCGQLNRLMCRNMAQQGFISFFYAVMESQSKRLTYCNPGHNPPIWVQRAEDSFHRLDCGGGVLGIMEHWQYDEQEICLRSGDRLLLYTDGITESRNFAGEEFGEDRLIDVVLRFETHDAAALAEAVVFAARHFSNGNFEDDLTVVAITVE